MEIWEWYTARPLGGTHPYGPVHLTPFPTIFGSGTRTSISFDTEEAINALTCTLNSC